MVQRKQVTPRKPAKAVKKISSCRTAKCTGTRTIKWRGGQGPGGKPLNVYACSQCGRNWSN